MHWRTASIDEMFFDCRAEAIKVHGLSFERSYFFAQIPPFVKLKKQQDGLCPHHFTAHAMERESIRKRNLWHKDCSCPCAFCSQCKHGHSPLQGSCFKFTCPRCLDAQCPEEFTNSITNWFRPIQMKRPGGGLYWTNQMIAGTRRKFMEGMIEEMREFVTHDNHVVYHKEQLRTLLRDFKSNELVIKADFIQNIVHSRGTETVQSYYGKRQSQFLSFVVWCKGTNSETIGTKKFHVDYVSSYLSHNSLFFQKCVYDLLEYLRDELGFEFNKVFSNGAPIENLFMCKYCRYFLIPTEAEHTSSLAFRFSSAQHYRKFLVLKYIVQFCILTSAGIFVHWIFAPSNHGKGDCDSHGAVVKRRIRRFVLNRMILYYKTYVNSNATLQQTTI